MHHIITLFFFSFKKKKSSSSTINITSLTWKLYDLPGGQKVMNFLRLFKWCWPDSALLFLWSMPLCITFIASYAKVSLETPQPYFSSSPFIFPNGQDVFSFSLPYPHIHRAPLWSCTYDFQQVPPLFSCWSLSHPQVFNTSFVPRFSP